jgi:anti-anti-sigma factor
MTRTTSGQFSAAVDPSGRIALAGELDITRLDTLRAILDEALEGSGVILSVDASKLSFIDRSAVSELLRYQVLLAARQRRLWLDPVSDPVETVLDLFDLHHILGPMQVAA